MSESLFWAYWSLCWVIICEIICPARSEILHTRCFSTNITPTLTKIDLWIVISTSHTSFRKPRWYVVPKREIEADTIYHVSCACDECLKQFLNKPQSLGTSLSLWKKNISHFYLQDLMMLVLLCSHWVKSSLCQVHNKFFGKLQVGAFKLPSCKKKISLMYIVLKISWQSLPIFFIFFVLTSFDTQQIEWKTLLSWKYISNVNPGKGAPSPHYLQATLNWTKTL